MPYDDEGGVNVYVDGECLEHRSVESESAVTVSDDWPDFRAEIVVHVEYGDEKPIELETDGDRIPYSRANDPDSPAGGVVYQPNDGNDGPTVELRLDSECEDHGETEYDLSGVDV